MSTNDDKEDDQFLFDPSIFDDSNSSLFPRHSDIVLFSESHAVDYLRSLDEPIEPFWLRPPVLDADQVRKLYKLADDLTTICREENVRIWIDGGTLLGAVRHRGLIPWDDDMDFAIFKSDAKRFATRVLPRLRSLEYEAVEWWYGGCRVFPIDGDPLREYGGQEVSDRCKYPFADIFWMRPEKKSDRPSSSSRHAQSAVEDRLVYWDSRARCLWPSGLRTSDLTSPLRSYQFGPIELPGPDRYEEHLDSLYGDDWANVVYQTRENHQADGSLRKMKIRVKLDHFPALIPDSN